MGLSFSDQIVVFSLDLHNINISGLVRQHSALDLHYYVEVKRLTKTAQNCVAALSAQSVFKFSSSIREAEYRLLRGNIKLGEDSKKIKTDEWNFPFKTGGASEVFIFHSMLLFFSFISFTFERI